MARHLSLRSIAIGVVVLAGCGAAREAPPTATPPVAASSSAVAPARPQPLPPASSMPLDEASVYARLEPDLTACYEQGRKAVPTMLDGRLTLDASVDASGKATCVIVTDDRGLTQEVEDCMVARLAAARLSGGPSRVSVRVAVTNGKLARGTQVPASSALESVETHRMPDAFDVLETLVPELQACVRGLARTTDVRSVVVGARVAKSGQTECALATGQPRALPANVAECAEGVFRRARFPPPSGGPGLVRVPLTL